MSDVEDRPEDTEHASPPGPQAEAIPPEAPPAEVSSELPSQAVPDVPDPELVPVEPSFPGDSPEPPPTAPDEAARSAASPWLPPAAVPDEPPPPADSLRPPVAAPEEVAPPAVSPWLPPAAFPGELAPIVIPSEVPPVTVPDEPPPLADSLRPPVAAPEDVAPPAVSPWLPPVAGPGGVPPLAAAPVSPVLPPEAVRDEVAPLGVSPELPPAAAPEPRPSPAPAGWPPQPVWVGDAVEDHGWPVSPRQPELGTPYGAPAPPQLEAQVPERPHVRHSRNPVDRLTRGLPDALRVTIDWVVTIVGAVAIVLLVKAFVVNPYRIPSSSMEPTLHCATPAIGCEARYSDRVLANRFLYRIRDPRRGEIIVFKTPPAARVKCGAGGTFVKRLIGLPGDRVELRLKNGNGYVYINGKPLKEPYVEKARRGAVQEFGPVIVRPGNYFMMGDNRSQSCDSRMWGTVPRENLIGKVFATYWPPNRVSLH